jgi:hypothetical protein
VHQLGDPAKRPFGEVRTYVAATGNQFDQLTPLHRPPPRIRGGLVEHGRQAVVKSQVSRSFAREWTPKQRWTGVNVEGRVKVLIIP